tara:strand:+ start:368 stop:1033 length:666 start_codon:yes stop_codon:yes gene_type:complete
MRKKAAWALSKTKLISKGLSDLGFETREDAVIRLSSYLDLVVRWNKRINLVSRKDINRLLERHLFDSLSIERFIKGDRALDIGSGGGFPGIPLAICRPDLHFTLLDRSARRVRFLQVVQAELGLQNVDCVCQNLPGSGSMNNAYDVAFARAVSDPSTIWRLSEQLLKNNGRLIFFLSTQLVNSDRKRELQENRLEGISWQMREVHVPNLKNPHKILVMDKK